MNIKLRLLTAALILLLVPVSLAARSKENIILGGLGLLKSMYDMRFDDGDELKTARKIEEEIAKKGIYFSDTALTDYVTRIIDNLKPFVVRDRGAFQHYRLYVIKDHQLNAFTVGAGYLFINTGIIARLENEAQLAGVLAHEMAHVSKNHIQQSVHEYARLNGALSLATIGAGDKLATMSRTANLVLNMSLNAMVNGWGREKEELADLTAVQYVSEAGYDPREIPKVFQIFLDTHGDPDPIGSFFYSNHPENRKRILYVNQLIRDKYGSLPFADLKVNAASYEQATKNARLAAGRDLIQSGQFNSGQALLNRVLAVDTTLLDAYYWMGESYRLQKKPELRDKAMAWYRDALYITENYPNSYLGVGMLFFDERRFPEARTNFEKYLALKPDAPDREQVEKLIRQTQYYRW